MEVTGVRVKDELVKSDSLVIQFKEENKTDTFSADKNDISKIQTTPEHPFIPINPKASFKDITFVGDRRGATLPVEENNILLDEKYKNIFKKLPVTDSGIDDESNAYTFSAYPKSNKKYQLGDVKAKLESFEDITGLEHGTFRIQYGNTTGDKKFNFDGASIGLELETRQDGYMVNQRPEIFLPFDNNSNYFFEQRNLNISQNNGYVTGVVSLEGIKLGIKYEKSKGIDISTVEFHDGALTTNLVDFTKKYPYIAIPIYAVLAGGVVTGGYFLNKGRDPINLNLGSIIVYKTESEKNNLKLGISPSFSLTGADKFVDAFRAPGGAATIMYKYDNNLTVNLNGGYNSIDGPHAFAGAAMKF